MDVEGAEWGFLESVKPETLAQFGQIAFEFHGMINPANPEQVLNALRKINITHQLVHIHANNFSTQYISFDGKNFVDDLEASYVIRKGHNFRPEYDVNLPLQIDMPCAKNHPKIDLGHWNMKTKIDGRFSLMVRQYTF